MTILFIGSSPSDIGGATIENTSTNGRDPNFTPVGSKVRGNFNTNGAPFSISFDAPSGDLWIHYKFYTNAEGYNLSHSNSDGNYLYFYSGSDRIAYIDVENGAWRLVIGNEITVINKPPLKQTVDFDYKVTSDGTNITFEQYIGGTLQFSITKPYTGGKCDRISFTHYDLVSYDGSDRDWCYSEMIVTDGEPTIGWRLSTLTSAANGTFNDWNGDYTGVQAVGDGNGIASDAVGEKQSWTLSTYNGPTTGGGIRALASRYVGSSGTSGPANITPFVKKGASEADSTPLSLDGTPKIHVMDNDPVTNAPWNSADLATLELGVRSET